MYVELLSVEFSPCSRSPPPETDIVLIHPSCPNIKYSSHFIASLRPLLNPEMSPLDVDFENYLLIGLASFTHAIGLIQLALYLT